MENTQELKAREILEYICGVFGISLLDKDTSEVEAKIVSFFTRNYLATSLNLTSA